MRVNALAPQYNVMARSQKLVTWQRLLVGTAVSLAVPYYVLGSHATLVVVATVLVVTASAIYYCQAIIQGVVGDYVGERHPQFRKRL